MYGKKKKQTNKKKKKKKNLNSLGHLSMANVNKSQNSTK